jgi:hypothetical protein
MNKELLDLESLEPALQKFLFESPTPEEGLMVVLQNPQLLTHFVDTLFISLINDAKTDGNDELMKLYRGRRILLQAVKKVLSKKDIALLHSIRVMLLESDESTSQKEYSLNTDDSKDDPEFTTFQEIMVKILVWLKAPTLEQGINILHRYPELLTDKPIRMFSWLMEEAHKHGDEMFVQVLKTLREFFQTIRLTLMDKQDITTEEIRDAVKQALMQIDFSILTDDQEDYTFLA